MPAHSQRGHAKLAPSASERWSQCPGSIRMSRGIERGSSRFADEGSAAHELAAWCLKAGTEADAYRGFYVDIETGFLFGNAPGDKVFLIDDEMVEGVQVYLDHCNSRLRPDVEREIEQHVSLEYLGVEGLTGGTADFTRYDPATRTLEIVDFKYGRGVAVEPEHNKQLLSYALGAAKRFHNRGLDTVVLTVVQPRAPHARGPVRSWEIDFAGLMEFEADLVIAARLTQSDDAPLIPGEWCRFCPARATCPARAQQALEIARAEFAPSGEMKLPAPATLTSAEVAKTLGWIDQLDNWLKDFREFAFEEARRGRVPPGFKLVAKRATRKWRDEAEATHALQVSGLALEEILVEPKMRSPAQLEKLLPGKNQKERASLLEGLVSRDSSGATLVPSDDPRPPLKADAASDFQTEGNT